ncbi:hypothetical protein PHLCEN_2v6604 [Hermanssonia centrifuga]|uniref:Uncharacterized protein n=1 Tax=Hermanssonia centrifuga TaxID=98765 RepID=A0A2R6NZL2_9APHY|nr:hypothetical protein PHLCEN_2v6604 [Hermanssonia centrifuga]
MANDLQVRWAPTREVSGRETIRLLRDFKDELFKASHNPQLLAEDDHLEELDETTKVWWEKMGRGGLSQIRVADMPILK